jgi:hypothetical protein
MHEPTRADLLLMQALEAELEQLNGEVEALNRETAVLLNRVRAQAMHTEADHAELRRQGERRSDLIERIKRWKRKLATADGTAGTA